MPGDNFSELPINLEANGLSVVVKLDSEGEVSALT